MKSQIEEKGTTQMFMRVTAMGLVVVAFLLGLHAGFGKSAFELESTIAFSSTRDDPSANPLLASEIYLMNPDGTNLRRLTENAAGDGFAALSRDGKKIIFDSNRNRAEGEPLNTSDLFVMETDGANQVFVVRGSSATWSSNSEYIAYHASASGTGLPTRPDPGAATSDSDIFVANLDDLLNQTTTPTNLTNSPEMIDDDADWSPPLFEYGQLVEKIVFTRHPVTDDRIRSNQAEIYIMNTDGTGLMRLTFNTEEERGASWSPDGTRIVYACRIGGGAADFEICVMDANGANRVQLTNNTVPDLTPTFSPDGQKIVFHRLVGGRNQLFVINADSPENPVTNPAIQLTNSPGLNLLANWGELRVHLKQ